jgi:hypothetical protein
MVRLDVAAFKYQHQRKQTAEVSASVVDVGGVGPHGHLAVSPQGFLNAKKEGPAKLAWALLFLFFFILK